MLKKLAQWMGNLRTRDPAARFAAIDAELTRRWSVGDFDALRDLGESGHVQAQFRLGQMYERGEGVVQSVVDAVHWYRAAAEQNHSPAHERLGLIYSLQPLAPAALSMDTAAAPAGEDVLSNSPLAMFFPRGLYVGQDYEESARWNRLAAAAGSAAAQSRLGHQYALGLGVEQDFAESEAQFARAADAGDTAGGRGLGILFAGGYGEQGRDDRRALQWLTVAAEREDAIAQRWLGRLLMRSEGELCNPSSAVVWFERAAQQGDEESMVALGLAYRRGHGVEADVSVAESWLRRAAARGNSDAACALGQLLLDRPEDDGIEAAQWLRQAADTGHRRAAAIIAHLHLSGHGLPKNLMEAERWLHMAGPESEPESYTRLAWLHSQDTEGTQDFAAVAKWLAYAAERGSVNAHYNLGSLYRLGQGVERDLETAARFYRHAAEAGKAEGAFHLGLLCAAGDGVEQDFEEAIAWFTRASEAGHLSARCNLAFLILEGRGVAADPAQATALLESAAAEGSVEAAEALFRLNVDAQNVPTDVAAGLRFIERAVELGSPMCAEILAGWLLTGEYLPQDRARARALLEHAAHVGHARAQGALGRLLAGAELDDEVPDLETQPMPMEDDARVGRLVLVAEDNDINQKVIGRQLELLGFDAEIVSDGRRALDCWRSGVYAMLLTDLHMPVMDGYELTVAIRGEEQRGVHMPIVALTANALKGEARRCEEMGMDDFMTKPMQLVELHAMLQKWMPSSSKPLPLRKPRTSDARPRASQQEMPLTILAPAADLSSLIALVGDDPRVLADMLASFCLSAGKLGMAIRRGVIGGSFEAVGEAAHTLKSGARSVGARRLAELCEELQTAADSGRGPDLERQLRRFELELGDVQQFIGARGTP